MILQKLSLENFRNFKQKKFKFSDKTTLMVGPNTSGKTSLLEAIYLLCSGGSFRAERSEEMIRFGGELSRIKGIISDGRLITESTENKSFSDSVTSGVKSNLEDTSNSVSQKARKDTEVSASVPSVIKGISGNSSGNSGITELEVLLTRGVINGKRVAKKKYLVNGVARRLPKFVGNFYGVIFRPEDIDLISGPPSLRRDYLDEVLEQVDREYQRSLLSYKKGLRARNKLLEKAKGEPQFRRVLQSQLYFWDKLLVRNGQLICLKREEYLAFVNHSLAEKSDIQVAYRKNVISEKRLAEWREREILIGMTMIGPQRDDFVVASLKLKTQNLKRNLAVYGSRGEHRLAVLYLKMAQLEYILEKTGQKPTLLLDDIFAELDVGFRKRIFQIMLGQQTIITTTEPKLISDKFFTKMELLKL